TADRLVRVDDPAGLFGDDSQDAVYRQGRMDRERSRRDLDEAGRLLLLPLQQPGDLLPGLLAFAEVTQNFDVPSEAPVLQGGGQAARPKAAPVFSNEPVIVGRPADG